MYLCYIGRFSSYVLGSLKEGHNVLMCVHGIWKKTTGFFNIKCDLLKYFSNLLFFL